MASNKSEETLIDVADAYSKTETFINKNSKHITTGILIVLGAIVAFFAYQKFIIEPQNEEAAAMMWKSEYYFGIDSLRLALEGDGNNYGFLDVAEEYGSTPAGNLATHYAGLSYLNLGDYESAVMYLDKASFDDVLVEATRLGALGDAYLELGDWDKAISSYEKSVSHTANDFTTPIYLKKLGLAYEAAGNPQKALDSFQRIKVEFGQTNAGRDIEKHIARVTAALAANG
ncbi:MAG: tetratricopeptide repeat protein [Flavobacteriales bacterium]|nr:tetratricopeptide repeat protein [Flavobacteriales bacterium]